MALVANIDLQLRLDASRRERIPATAGNLSVLIIWMDAVFHGVVSIING